MPVTPNLGLTLLNYGQTNAYAIINDNLRKIDNVGADRVYAKEIVPNPSTALGFYAQEDLIVISGATESPWLEKNDTVQRWTGVVWEEVPCKVSTLIWVVSEGEFYVKDDTLGIVKLTASMDINASPDTMPINALKRIDAKTLLGNLTDEKNFVVPVTVVDLAAALGLPEMRAALTEYLFKPGDVKYSFSAVEEPGWLPYLKGQLLNKVDYPRLWTFASTKARIVDEANFSANPGCFGYGPDGPTGETFRVPNMQGLFIRVLDEMTEGGFDIEKGRLIGSWQTYGIQRHLHAVNDAGHTHPVNDPGHGHHVNDPGHGHGVYDPGHSHYVNDPGHTHWYEKAAAALLGVISGAPGSLFNTTGAQTGGAGTGIWNSNSGTGISIYGAATGIWNSNSGTGISIAASNSGITLNETGIDETRPVNVALRLMMKY